MDSHARSDGELELIGEGHPILWRLPVSVVLAAAVTVLTWSGL
jgi:hypothetical protein